MCCVAILKWLLKTPTPTPICVLPQYHPGTFKEATLDPAVFAVPEACQKTATKCFVQPTQFCDVDPLKMDDDEA